MCVLPSRKNDPECDPESTSKNMIFRVRKPKPTKVISEYYEAYFNIFRLTFYERMRAILRSLLISLLLYLVLRDIAIEAVRDMPNFLAGQ